MNVFLFEVTANKEQSFLGELRKNSRNLILEPQQGYFVLKASTGNPLALAKAREKYQFKISTNNSELKFEEKLEMFKFLVSQESKVLTSLAFDRSQIFDKSSDAISVKSAEGVGSEPCGGVERKEPPGMSDDQNNTVEVQREDAVVESSFISMLEEEIRDLRNELESKDEVIERQTTQNEKMEDQLKQIDYIVSSSLIHEEQQ